MAHQLLLLQAPVRAFDSIPKSLLGHTLLGLTALVVTCTSPGTVWAQSTSEPEQIDTARGTISGSTRRIGLGGAFVAIADDTEGVAINPASVALRLPYSWHAWDYGVGVDFAVGAWLPKNDLYNQPDSAAAGDSSALFGSLAAIIYYQHAGLGVAAEAQRNATSQPAQMQGVDTNLAANFGMVHASLAYGFADGQVLVGAGPRIVGVSFDRHSSGSGPLSQAGLGAEAGLMIKPQVAQYRVALAVKSPIDAVVPGDAGAVEQTLHIPWEAALGFAYQFGVRPFNPPFATAYEAAKRSAVGSEPTKAELEHAEDELYQRYQRLQRWYLLVSTELSLIEGGGRVGVAGQVASSRPIISPRLGLESEIIPHHFRLRAGSYYEPPLTDAARPRVHGTGGFDLRLFEWDVFGLVRPFDYWQLSVAADGARSYLNTSFSIGFWH